MHHSVFPASQNGASMRVAIVALNYGREYVALSSAVLAGYIRESTALGRAVEFHLVTDSLDNTNVVIDVAAALRDIQPAVLGLSCYVWNYERLCSLLEVVRLDDCIVVVGGPEVSHASIGGELLARGADFIIRGEGEIALAQLLQLILRGETEDAPNRVRGVSSAARASEEYADCLRDLSSIPDVYRNGYAAIPRDVEYVPVEFSRGCTRSCNYCFFNRGKAPLRYRHFEMLRRELDFLDHRGIRSLRIVDTDIARSRQRFHDTIRLLQDYSFLCEADINDEALSPDDCSALFGCGIQSIEIGIQSTNPAALHVANRTQEMQRIASSAFNMRRAGIRTCAQLIYGLPRDGLDGFARSVRDVVEMGFDCYDVFALLGLPGTGFAENADAFGLAFNARPPHDVVCSPGWKEKELGNSSAVVSGASILSACDRRGCPYYPSSSNGAAQVRTEENCVRCILTVLHDMVEHRYGKGATRGSMNYDH